MTRIERICNHRFAAHEATLPSDDMTEVQMVYVSQRDAASGSWQVTNEFAFAWEITAALSLATAQALVDDSLAQTYCPGMTFDELMARYRTAGPDPYLRYENRALMRTAHPISAAFFIDQPIPFNAWGYAEEVGRRLCGVPPQEPSRALAHWSGRYDRYDHQRMEAQLLLNRQVRLNRDVVGEQETFPAGSIGVVSGHSRLVDSDCYDFSRELPILFLPKALPLWRRCLNNLFDQRDTRESVVQGIPYDALEFVESDADFAAQLRDELPYAETSGAP